MLMIDEDFKLSEWPNCKDMVVAGAVVSVTVPLFSAPM